MIPRVTITVRSMPDIRRIFLLSPRLAADKARGLGKEVLELYTEAFRQEAPRAKGAPSRTGGLQARIEGVAINSDRGMIGEVRMPHYGIFTIPPGTRPHDIFPRPPRRALKFFWQKGGTAFRFGPRLGGIRLRPILFHGGKTVFFARVWHPGYRGDPWPERAMAKVEPKVSSIVDRAGATFIVER